jgi:hypothetical protein
MTAPARPAPSSVPSSAVSKTILQNPSKSSHRCSLGQPISRLRSGSLSLSLSLSLSSHSLKLFFLPLFPNSQKRGKGSVRSSASPAVPATPVTPVDATPGPTPNITPAGRSKKVAQVSAFVSFNPSFS